MDDTPDCVILSKNASFSSNEDEAEDILDHKNVRYDCLNQIDKILAKNLDGSNFDYVNAEGHTFSRSFKRLGEKKVKQEMTYVKSELLLQDLCETKLGGIKRENYNHQHYKIRFVLLVR